MSKPAIEIQSLSKRYVLGQGGGFDRTMCDAVSEFARRLLHFRRSERQMPREIWALRDINFDVQPGEVIGIVGSNGTGKSTLLKILARITDPTLGSATIRGRVASLLEVGTGFHPELTGRENIFLNGSILGMTRAEVKARFDAIVDFSGVETFLDTPVKRYSSGMRVRLAFAIAAHLDPEILIVDEVLAVGDVAFQQKCLGKLQSVAQGEGRTVLFVSHNLGAVRSLCSRAIFLEKGRLIADGTAEDIAAQYLHSQTHNDARTGKMTWPVAQQPGDDTLRLESISLHDPQGTVRSTFSAQESFDLHVRYRVLKPLAHMRIVAQLYTMAGETVFTTTDDLNRADDHTTPGTYTTRCRIPARLLNLGEYALHVWAGVTNARRLAATEHALPFTIEGIANNGSKHGGERMPGVIAPQLTWSVQPHEQPQSLVNAA